MSSTRQLRGRSPSGEALLAEQELAAGKIRRIRKRISKDKPGLWLIVSDNPDGEIVIGVDLIEEQGGDNGE